jgi:hypothetical protein
MPDNVAQRTSRSISGRGCNTRQRWRGSRNVEKWSSSEAESGEVDMDGSESSKPSMNHIPSTAVFVVNLKRLPC